MDSSRLCGNMDFMFEWQERYLTSERSERVKYRSSHQDKKFISSHHRAMFFALYGQKLRKESWQKQNIILLQGRETYIYKRNYMI